MSDLRRTEPTPLAGDPAADLQADPGPVPDELDDQAGAPWQKLADEIATSTGRRVHLTLFPEHWSDDEAKRITRLVTFILNGDGVRLYGMECAAAALTLDTQGRPL
jgi:hypothetical protein